jgi:Putative MetA-pathway of phenol degradation
MTMLFGRFSRGVVRLVIVIGGTLLLPAAARPCSMCRCGDATFNALGKDGFAAVGWHLALDGERFDKTEGDPAADAESLVEHRYTFLGSYGLGEKVTLLARVPWSERSLVQTSPGGAPGTVNTRGLGDPEIQGQVRLWRSRFGAGIGRRASLTLTAGVKTPWGENEVTQGGTRVDEHAQPGTGATDLTAGLAFLYLLDGQSAVFASTAYRRTGTNSHGYRYGSALLANLTWERKIGGRLDGVVELNFRSAARDVVDASQARDPDTGGSLLYVTPRLLVDLGRGVVLRAAVQIPTLRSLNGFQQERAVVNVGLTYVVGTR